MRTEDLSKKNTHRAEKGPCRSTAHHATFSWYLCWKQNEWFKTEPSPGYVSTQRRRSRKMDNGTRQSKRVGASSKIPRARTWKTYKS